MHYVYILYSEKVDRYYIGYSRDPQKRLHDKHNAGKVKATRNGIPYVLKVYKGFLTEIEAIGEERRIKKMKSRKFIERLIIGPW